MVAIGGIFVTGNQRLLREGKITGADRIFDFVQVAHQAFAHEKVGREAAGNIKNCIACEVQNDSGGFFHHKADVKLAMHRVDGIIFAGFGMSYNQHSIFGIVHSFLRVFCVF